MLIRPTKLKFETIKRELEVTNAIKKTLSFDLGQHVNWTKMDLVLMKLCRNDCKFGYKRHMIQSQWSSTYLAHVIQGPSICDKKMLASKHDIWHVEIAIFHAAARVSELKKSKNKRQIWLRKMICWCANGGVKGGNSYESQAAP